MPSNPRHPSLIRRLTAVLGIALVGLLAALAASPELHALAHASEETAEHAGHDHVPVGNAGHECVVTLFSHGVTGLLVFCLLMLARLPARGTVLRPDDWLVAGRVRYWHVPSHAPPLA